MKYRILKKNFDKYIKKLFKKEEVKTMILRKEKKLVSRHHHILVFISIISRGPM